MDHAFKLRAQNQFFLSYFHQPSYPHGSKIKKKISEEDGLLEVLGLLNRIQMFYIQTIRKMFDSQTPLLVPILCASFITVMIKYLIEAT